MGDHSAKSKSAVHFTLTASFQNTLERDRVLYKGSGPAFFKNEALLWFLEGNLGPPGA